MFDPVFVMNPGRGPKWLAGHVIDQTGNSVFVVELSRGHTVCKQIDQLRRRHCEPNPPTHVQPVEGEPLLSIPVESQVPQPNVSEPVVFEIEC